MAEQCPPAGVLWSHSGGVWQPRRAPETSYSSICLASGGWRSTVLAIRVSWDSVLIRIDNSRYLTVVSKRSQTCDALRQARPLGLQRLPIHAAPIRHVENRGRVVQPPLGVALEGAIRRSFAVCYRPVRANRTGAIVVKTLAWAYNCVAPEADGSESLPPPAARRPPIADTRPHTGHAC